MNYQINTTNYHTFDVFQVNKLDPRTYFIPFPDRTGADAVSLREKRYASPKVTCLSGEWDFHFYPIPSEMPVLLDTENMDFDKIDVPSCWQFRGYDKPFYVNTRYQFPYNPPHIPATEKVGTVFSWMGVDKGIVPRWQKPENEYNFVGLYRKKIELEDMSRDYILSFLGVASCLDLYVNGAFVGYSEGTHNTAEFDITNQVLAGENEIVAVVHRWCNGSYLEAQDMFRNNGIFRDVLLRVSEPVDFWDIDFQTRKTSAGYRASVCASLTDEGTVTFTLEGNGIQETRTAQTKNRVAEAVFENLEVQEWNAENPVLYNLYYEIEGSCIKARVGFKKVSIEGNVFKINDRILKFHGVNHHDTSSTNGFSMTLEELEKDVRLCKEFNIETIRMSHYPPDPYLLELCDELGIYVVDEADIETHGVYSMVFPPSYNRISDNPKWADHYVDRAARMYQRDKMHVSIFMWSLGNEAGGTCNTDKEAEYLKKYTDIPVHYESAIHTRKKAYDVGSQMYPPVDRVRAVGEGTCKIRRLLDRPYFLCEYAHAMGVGPGNVEDYWEQIYAHDNLMGGCVWEMVDHAVLHKDGSYTYGGDHGEWEHDGNFCVDGLFYPDRTPSTGAWLIRYIYRPIRVRWLGENTFEIFNTTGFTEGSIYRLECQWSDGRKAVVIPDVKPLEKIHKIILPDSEEVNEAEILDGDLLLTIRTIDTRSGKEVAVEQLCLEQRDYMEPTLIEKAGLLKNLSLKKGNFSLTLPTGKMVAAKPYTICFRAATDNDTDAMLRNTMKPYYNEKEKIISISRSENRAVVKTQIRLKGNTLITEDIYESCREGILVTTRIRCEKGKGELPRFGKTYLLTSDFNQVSYQGRCGESYIDMKEQFPIQKVNCQVSDMTEPNIRPQESGNRCDCSSVSVSNGKTTVTIKAIQKPFELSIKPYSDRELITMKHREDEKASGTYVTINAFQKGIGTGSCGPVTHKRHCFSLKESYELQYLITVK